MPRFILLLALLMAPAAFAQSPAAEVRDSLDQTIFQLNTDGGFFVGGKTFKGAIPTSGPGTRLMWYPKKAAFRAGFVGTDHWDDENIGFGSVALGASTIASGDNAVAIGSVTVASGGNAVALGANTTASHHASTALGSGTMASGSVSTAIGYETTASGNYALTTGRGTSASGYAATAMGLSTTASGYVSAATGYETTASGYYTTAMGLGTRAQSKGSLVIGRYNTVSGSPDNWISTDPLFVAGNGSGNAFRSNAFVLYKNGDIDATGLHTVRFNSSLSKPHLRLVETETNDYARLRFSATSNANYWDLAGHEAGLNFYSNIRGNVLSLRSSGHPLATSTGAYLSAGGAWTNSSDSTLKAGFTAMDAEAVLQKLASLPVTRWHYKGEAEADHVGPMAQDFRAAFGLGSDERSIATVDADGVLMLAVQALEKRTRELEDHVALLEMENEVIAHSLASAADTLAVRIAELETRLAALALTSTSKQP